jgi:hypothetical protein
MKKTLLFLFLTCFGAFAYGQTTNITFQLDMNTYTGTFTTPEVNGTWNNWCGNCNAMSDPDNDGIWTAVIPIATGTTVEFKYSHDNWAGQETNNPSEPCTNGNTQFTNRVLVIPATDTVLGVVCWGSCSPCSGQPTSTNVTFKVDMSEYTGSFTTPEINGTFNNWCGNCAQMSDSDNDNIWDITINLPRGDTIEYKFSHDNWAGQEMNDSTGACTNGNGQFTNRVLILDNDTVMPPVCWGSCNPCGSATSVATLEALEMKVYPNPASGSVTVQTAEAGTLRILDLSGRLMLSTPVSAGEQQIAIDGLSAGLYLVQINSQKAMSSQRLVIQ